MFSNYHTHSTFCDGHAEPEQFVLQAINRGLKALGFSSHAPVPFANDWSMKYEKIEQYRDTILFLKEKYKDKIKIHLGMEIDYIPGITTSFAEFRQRAGLEYAIGGIHLVRNGDNPTLWFIDGAERNFDEGLKLVFNNDIRSAVATYYHQLCEMIQTQKPDVIAHFDKVKMNNRKRYFTEDEPWYQELVKQTIDVIATSGAIVEVNTRGIYMKRSDSLYPGIALLEQCHRKNIPVTISADAHDPEQVNGYFPETVEIIKQIGFRRIMVLEENGWKPDIL